MEQPEPRIVTLIPSATEIVAALGLGERIVGRSHECDWPQGIERVPALSRPRLETSRSSAEIHESVTALVNAALSVYDLDAEGLERLRPTHIITQTRCKVCAVSLEEVEQAVASLTARPARIVSLEAKTLGEVLGDIRRVGDALGVEAEPLIARLESRIEALRRRTSTLPEAARKSVACIEWTDPLMAAGNWVPELVGLAGGRDSFARAGEHGRWLEWELLASAEPEAVVFMPCGYDLARTEADARAALQRSGWRELRAVQKGEVYATDGHRYFNRPGPRLVESAEILAEILHPESFSFGHEGEGWRQLPSERWA